MDMETIRDFKIELQKPYSNEFRKRIHLKLIEKIQEENKKLDNIRVIKNEFK